MKLKRLVIISASFLLIIIGALIIFAYSKTWEKTDIEIKIHINEKLVQESAFGESPTFAIWLENAKTHKIKTVFVTRRAAEKDWEGKAEVPVALPAWFHINSEKKAVEKSEGDPDQIIISGATPKPGYFVTSVSVEQNSEWILWIEVNLAGDFNEYYMEFNKELNITDEFSTGQPALIYKAKISAIAGTTITPEIAGISMPGLTFDSIIKPMKGITTATDVFDEISLQVVKTKLRIINTNK